jgi:cytoskeletal protein RodZ
MSTGQMIQQAREAAGLSLDQVAAATKIRSSILAAMEEDNFSHCGGDVYARGQLKSIAAVVGLDPDDVVDSYDAGH